MPTPLTTLTVGMTLRVTILSWTTRDLWTSMVDNHNGPHQFEIDGKTSHQQVIDGITDHHSEFDEKVRHQSGTDAKRQVSDGNSQSRSTIMGKLCKWVLTHIKWQIGVDTDIDVLVMDTVGRWLCHRGNTAYIDPL
jgi:hypothetical protein